MGYLIAAYGVTILALVAYGLHLARERRRLGAGDRDGAQGVRNGG